jgi:hypothetical protein
MSSHTRPAPEPPPPESLEAGYEKRDVNIRGILWLAVGVIAAAIVVHVCLWILLQEYRAMARRQDPKLSPLAAEKTFSPPPRLQSEPIRDYHQFQAEQDALLQHYSWVDKKEGIVRIPVSRAMDVLVERGLPNPKGPTTPQQADQDDKQPQSNFPSGDKDSDGNSEPPPREPSDRQTTKD